MEFLGNYVTTEKNFEVLPYTLSHAEMAMKVLSILSKPRQTY